MITVTELNGADGDQAAADRRPSSRRRKVLVLLVAAILVAAAAWWFLLRPSGPEEPKPGAMLPLESTQINLAGGHYLKIGIALQLTESAGQDVDGSKALDATIDLFSGQSVEDISKAETRKALKRKLSSELEDRYDGDVMGVYFTEFVTQ